MHPIKSKITALLNKLKSNRTQSPHPLRRSKPHALFDKVRGQKSADDDYENEGDHDEDDADMQLQDVDDDDTAHTPPTPTKQRTAASSSSSSASSMSSEVDLVNGLISQIARNNPQMLQQLTLPISKTASTAHTHQSSFKQPAVRIVTQPTPVPVLTAQPTQSSFAAAMQSRLPTSATSSSASSAQPHPLRPSDDVGDVCMSL